MRWESSASSFGAAFNIFTGGPKSLYEESLHITVTITITITITTLLGEMFIINRAKQGCISL